MLLVYLGVGVAVLSVLKSFYMIYEYKQGDTCPAPADDDSLVLIHKNFARPSFRVADLVQHGYDSQSLIREYLSQSLQEVDRQALDKIKSAGAEGLTTQVRNLEEQFQKVTSTYKSLLERRETISSLLKQHTPVNCELTDSTVLEEKYKALKESQTAYEEAWALLPKQDQGTSLNDLLYRRAKSEAELNVLKKRLQFMRSQNGGAFLTAQQRASLEDELRRLKEQQEGVRRQIESVAQKLRDLNFESKMNHLQKTIHKLQIQIEEEELARKYNQLKDRLIQTKGDLTEYKLNLTETIKQCQADLRRDPSRLKELSEFMEEVKSTFRKILIYNNNVTFTALRKEQLLGPSKQELLAKSQNLLEKLRNNHTQLQEEHARAYDRRMVIERRISELRVRLIEPDAQNDQGQIAKVQSLIMEEEARLSHLNAEIRGKKDKGVELDPGSSLKDFRKIQADYKSKLQEFDCNSLTSALSQVSDPAVGVLQTNRSLQRAGGGAAAAGKQVEQPVRVAAEVVEECPLDDGSTLVPLTKYYQMASLLGLGGLPLLLLQLFGLLRLLLLLVHPLALGLLPLSLGLLEVPAEHLRLEVLAQGGPALHPLAVVPAVLRTLHCGALLEVLEQLASGVVVQVFVYPLPVDLDHGRVDAGPETLHLLESEQPVWTGVPQLDPGPVLAGLDDVLTPPQQAGSGPADLQVELAHRLSVEHGVEGGHLVHVHLVDPHNLCHLPHRAYRKEVVVLLLRQGQQRNYRALLAVLGVVAQDRLYLLLPLRVELEHFGLGVGGSLQVLEIAAREPPLSPQAQCSHHPPKQHFNQESPVLLFFQLTFLRNSAIASSLSSKARFQMRTLPLDTHFSLSTNYLSSARYQSSNSILPQGPQISFRNFQSSTTRGRLSSTSEASRKGGSVFLRRLPSFL